MNILLYDTGDVRGELNEPIGIEILATHAYKRFGNTISIDLKWYNFDKFDFDPSHYDIIGISIHINGMPVFEKLCSFCYDSGFCGLMIAGNSVATFAYEQLLAKHPSLICSLGEGEGTFPELVNYKMGGLVDLSSIHNIAYVLNGKIVLTQRETFDMQEYIPPLRPFAKQIKNKNGIIRIEGSRGCVWNKCSFCGAAHKYNYSGWRPAKIDVIIEQLISLSGLGLNNVYFCDEDFIGNDTKRFSELVQQIDMHMKDGAISPNMGFFISVKPNDLLNPDNILTIKSFMKCGLKDLFTGIESGCENQLKRYNKCSNKKINTIAINKMRELESDGLMIDIGFIFFDYYMTPADVEENLQFIEDNKLYTFASSLIKPLRIQPYTKTFENTPEVHENEFSVDDLFYKYSFADCTVNNIYKAYNELRLENIAHNLQSVYRRDMADPKDRSISQDSLLKLRFLEYQAIRTIADYYLYNTLSLHQLQNNLCTIKINALNLLKDQTQR